MALTGAELTCLIAASGDGVGLPAAALDVVDAERAGREGLYRMAERMGVDLRKLVVGE